MARPGDEERGAGRERHGGQDRRADGLNPELARLLRQAYGRRLDVDTAARHLWVIYRASARRRRRRSATLQHAVVSVLAVGALLFTSGLAVAASGPTLPGDVLYPVKREVERVQLLTSFTNPARARAHLGFASNRLAEADEASRARPAVVPGLVAEALEALDTAERLAGVQLAAQLASARGEASARIAAIATHLQGEFAADLASAAARLSPATAEPGGPGGRPPVAGDPSSVPTLGDAVTPETFTVQAPPPTATSKPPGDGDGADPPTDDALEPAAPRQGVEPVQPPADAPADDNAAPAAGGPQGKSKPSLSELGAMAREG